MSVKKQFLSARVKIALLFVVGTSVTFCEIQKVVLLPGGTNKLTISGGFKTVFKAVKTPLFISLVIFFVLAYAYSEYRKMQKNYPYQFDSKRALVLSIA